MVMMIIVFGRTPAVMSFSGGELNYAQNADGRNLFGRCVAIPERAIVINDDDDHTN